MYFWCIVIKRVAWTILTTYQHFGGYFLKPSAVKFMQYPLLTSLLKYFDSIKVGGPIWAGVFRTRIVVQLIEGHKISHGVFNTLYSVENKMQTYLLPTEKCYKIANRCCNLYLQIQYCKTNLSI
jgi:hypothetical protein